ERDTAEGGYRVMKVYSGDPEEPWSRSPLAQPGVNVVPGDIIISINGVPALDGSGPAALLRKQAGRQGPRRRRPVRLMDGTQPEERDVIVTPMTTGQEADLRYRTWEVERRRMVEDQSQSDIGYVHLRAMGGENYAEFARDFYPAFTRKGLI